MDFMVIGMFYGYEVVWNGGLEIGNDLIYNYVVMNLGFFKVVVIDFIGCFVIDSILVEVRLFKVYVFMVFSFNDDGNND